MREGEQRGSLSAEARKNLSELWRRRFQDPEQRARAAGRLGWKLDEQKVETILRRLNAGALQRELADEFGVTRGTISNIARGVTWAHVRPTDLPERGARAEPSTAARSALGETMRRRWRDPDERGRLIQSLPTRLTEADVRVIRRRVLEGERQAALAREFEVSDGTVSDLVLGRTWRHVS